MLEIKNVSKVFNKRKKNQINAIDHTTLSFESAGLTALLGASGSGKTTLLNVIGGLDKASGGEITVEDEKITRRRSGKVDNIRNKSIGYIFQNFKLIEDKSVYENVAIVLKMLGIKSQREIRERVEYVLDKVGMLRYKKRPASALSGGQRQRVAIARALVKDPSIILADEPTGNLDSKNTIEVMNIIKEISKERLVILVTHERPLAQYYSSRIIEIADGKVVSDYINEGEREYYHADVNDIYLGDFAKKETYPGVNIYKNGEEEIKLDIVIKNGNIYIRNSTFQKVEVVDQNSSIEIIEGKYQPLNNSSERVVDFKIKPLKKSKLKYSSIFRFGEIFSSGIKKIFAYTILKKLSLLGYALAAGFVVLSVAGLMPFFMQEDVDFMEKDRQYLTTDKQVSLSEAEEIKGTEGVIMAFPGDSMVRLNINNSDFYEFESASIMEVPKISISTMDEVTEEEIIYGRMPENSKEVVIDSMLAESLLRTGTNSLKNININSENDFVGKAIYPGNYSDFEYTIVGISNKNEPSAYFASEELLDVINYTTAAEKKVPVHDYNYVKDMITITKGEAPEKGETLTTDKSVDIGKELRDETTGKKLKVSGYYESDSVAGQIVNAADMEESVYKNVTGFTAKTDDKDLVLASIKGFTDGYENSKDEYRTSKFENLKMILIFTSVALVISFVEIFLILRASFISRVKEVGTLRAIGVKKSDIYKMFYGEIMAITLFASIPGVLFMGYIVEGISNMPYMDNFFIVNPFTILISIGALFIFNMIIGLLPVYNTIRKTPTQILARNDVN